MMYGHAEAILSLPRCACGQPAQTVLEDDQTPACARCALSELRASAPLDR
jgi:hypothetical protein